MADRQVFPKLGVSACVWRDGKVLIIQRGKPPVAGVWSLPGGHVEPGEELRAAAARELGEETGVTARLGPLVDVIDVIRRDAASGVLLAHYAVVCFAGHWAAGEPRPDGDALAARWVAPEDLEAFDFTPGTREVIARARTLLAF
jgi:8-oxo-dGTP diphosphatase